MAFQLLLLEFLIGGALLGGLVAYRKSVGERIVLLATVPIAYLIAYFLMRGGVFDFIGTSVLSALSGAEGLSEIISQSAATASGIAALINCIVRPLLLVPVFWILLLLLRILWSIVAGISGLRKKVAFFRPGEKRAVLKNFGVAAIGAFGGFVICMLSLLPITYFSNLLTPAFENIEHEQYNGTYVQAQSEVIHTTLLPLAKHTVPGAMQTYTGLRFVMDATVDGLGEVTLTDNSGHTVSFNGTRFVQTLAKDGAAAAAIYEFTCHPSAHTLADFAPIAEILEDLASDPALTAIGSELLSGVITPEEGEGEGDLANDVLSILAGQYSSADPAVLAGDLRAISSLFSVIATDLGDVELDDEDALSEELLTYLSDEEAAYRVLDALSDFHVYGDVFGMLAEAGVEALADVLDVSEDRTAHHNAFMLRLVETLNDRTGGTYDKAGVDAFIRYAAENGFKVGAYREGENATIDAAYRNYIRYIDHVRELEGILAVYTDAAEGSSFYVTANEKVYVYNAKADTWAEATADAALAPAAYLAEQLLHRADALLMANGERIFTEQDVRDLANELIAVMNGGEGYRAAAARLALAITDEGAEAFAPNAVYRTDIVGALKTDVTFTEEENRQFARILSAAADLFVGILGMEENADMMTSVMDEFGSVGRLLDGLSSFTMTEDVPEKMLGAIMQNENFGKYFDSDSINTLIEKVKAGSATYESLFESVRALFGIINQVIPQ